MKRAFQSSVFVLCVLFSVAGAYNVLSDNTEVERLAHEVACGAPSPSDAGHAGDTGDVGRRGPDHPLPGGHAGGVECHAQKTRMERTPLAQTFDFATTKKQVTVQCARSAILIGEYRCEVR